MVTVSFLAYSNDSLVVTLSSSPAIIGNGVINNSSTPDGTILQYSPGSAQSITINDTGGSTEIFEDDDPANHVITDGGTLIANGQTVEAESCIYLRALDANGDPTGPEICVTVFSQGGNVSDVWGLTSDTALISGTSYVKVGGDNLGTASYDTFVTCFASGTLIETPSGNRRIENLSAGDLVNTRDEGAQPIRWAGNRRVLGQGSFAPIRFEAGVLGNSETLWVTPEHRMVITHPMAELLFGTTTVMVAAKFLVGLNGIAQENTAEITYHHLLFDTHQVIRSAGCWSESFFLSSNAMAGLNLAAQREMQSLFPDMTEAMAHFGGTVEVVLKKHEAEVLTAALVGLVGSAREAGRHNIAI